MNHDPKRLDISLSSYKKTTDIFNIFQRINGIIHTPYRINYVYDTLHLKDFMTIALDINGCLSKYSVGFLVKHCDFWDKEAQEKRKCIECGMTMSELKNEHYKKYIHKESDYVFIDNILNAVSQYIASGKQPNESIIPFSGFELYAQDSFSRNHPGAGIEYGETNTYLVCEIVVSPAELVWAE